MPSHSEHTIALRKITIGAPKMADHDWTALESEVDELIGLCGVLTRENRALRAQQQNWTTERAKLIEKNELAKSRVESMIVRLKALEQD